jgi:hypothetical protein
MCFFCKEGVTTVNTFNQQLSECLPKTVETESDLLSRLLFDEGDVYLSDLSITDLAPSAWAGARSTQEATA